MLHKNGDFIFRAPVISNSCVWQNVAEIALFTTASRLIRRAAFCGMGVDQFLASKIYMAGFKQTDWRHRQVQFCHSVSGSTSLAESGTGPRADCTPTQACWSRDHVDSPALSSRLAADSRLLPPRSGLERSDFVLWPCLLVAVRR